MPLGVRRIAMETTPNMIVNSTHQHSVQRAQNSTQHFNIAITFRLIQQEQEGRFTREFGRNPKPAIEFVNPRQYSISRGLHRLWRQILRSGRTVHITADQLTELCSIGAKTCTIRLPRIVDLAQNAQERVRRVIRARIKRISTTGQKHRIRPPATAR